MPKNRTSNKSNNNESANRKTKKSKSSKDNDNTLKNNLDTNKTASGSVESVTDSFQNADGAAGNGEVAEVNRIINDPAENTDTNAGLTPMNEMSPEMIYAQLGHMYRKAENCRTVRRKSKAKTILDDHMAMRKSPELIAEIYRAKGFGVTAGGYIDFINNDPIWEKHPEEHKICLGVVKFYSKHPEPPVAYKNFSVVFTNYELNPNEANKALLVEVLIWICDFISMAKATTAHITAFTGIVKVRLDAICRTPSNIGYKLLWEYYPEGWAEALEVRIENYDEYKEKRDKAWMADVVPDDHMKKYLREGRVLCMKEHPTRPEALELLRKGKMLAFGSIGLDDTGNFTDFSPWTTTHYDELKALLNDIVGDFNAVYNNRNNVNRLGECIAKPFRVVPALTDDDLIKNNDVYVVYVPRISTPELKKTTECGQATTQRRILSGKELNVIAEYYINQVRPSAGIYSDINDLLPLQLTSEHEANAYYKRISDGSSDLLGSIWEVVASAVYNDRGVCQAVGKDKVTDVPVPVYAYDGNERKNPLFYSCALLNELSLLIRNCHFANDTSVVFGLGVHNDECVKFDGCGGMFHQIPVKAIYTVFSDSEHKVHGKNYNILTYITEYEIGVLTLDRDLRIVDLQLSTGVYSLRRSCNVSVMPETDEFRTQYSNILGRYVNRPLGLAVRPMINIRQH